MESKQDVNCFKSGHVEKSSHTSSMRVETNNGFGAYADSVQNETYQQLSREAWKKKKTHFKRKSFYFIRRYYISIMIVQWTLQPEFNLD